MNIDGVFIGLIYKIGEINYYNVGDVLVAINFLFSMFFGDVLFWDVIVGKFSVKYGINGDVSVIIDVVDGEILDFSFDVVNGL